jgi:hypothetical protein
MNAGSDVDLTLIGRDEIGTVLPYHDARVKIEAMLIEDLNEGLKIETHFYPYLSLNETLSETQKPTIDLFNVAEQR